MSTLKPYPAYKDSGVEWLGEVPEHWTLQRASTFCHLQNRGVRDSDKTVTAFRDGQVTLRTNRRTDGFTEALQEIGYQGVREGDLVIHSMDGFAGAIGVSDSDGKMSPVVHVYQVVPGEARYYALLLRVAAQSGFIESLAKGIRERSTSFDRPTFKSMQLPIPSGEEQMAVLDFLDRETAEIDAFVAESEKLITLLNERRAAVITQAVTKGLDPTVPMKDTGIEWLGQVPAHWKLEAARSVVSDENHKNQLGQDAFYLSLVAGRGVMPYAEKGDIGNKMPEDLSRCKVVARGDLVINSMNYGIGSYGVSKFDGVCSPVYIVLRPKPSMDIRYVERIFECRPFQRLAQSFGNGILEHRRAINWDTLKSLRVPVPPAEEQKQIEESIRLRTAKIDEAIATAREAIALAKERRQALISAAVTGKIDVRAAA